MIETKILEVDGVRYEMSQYTTTKGWNLFFRLVEVGGSPIAKIIGETQKGHESLVDFDIVGKSIHELARNMNQAKSVDLVKEILEGIACLDGVTGTKINFDIFFSGRYGHLINLLKEVARFQFRDFLSNIKDFIPSHDQVPSVQPVVTRAQ